MVILFWYDDWHPGVNFPHKHSVSPVMIVQVCSHSSFVGSFHPSHNPTNTKGESSFYLIPMGTISPLAAPTAVHRIERLSVWVNYRIVTMRDSPSLFALHKDERQLVLSPGL
jgi:hypothetical protein